MKVSWSPIAVADRDAIFDHIAPENFQAALELDEVFRRKSALLGRHPEIGRLGREAGTREFVAHHHYVLVYDVHLEQLRILRLLHTARQWPIQSSARPRRSK